MTKTFEESSASDAWSAFCAASPDDPGIIALAEVSRAVKLSRGVSLVEQDDEDQTVYLILQGCVRIVQFTANGHEIWLSEGSAGHLIGELSALGADARTSSVIAQDDVLALAISGTVFLDTFHAHRDLSLVLSRLLAKRLTATSSQLVELVAMPVNTRLHAELSRIGRPDEIDSEVRHIDNPPTVSALAQYIHATREATSRALSRLEKHQLVVREGKSMRVIVPDGM